jgi:hypothetical protein
VRRATIVASKSWLARLNARIVEFESRLETREPKLG